MKSDVIFKYIGLKLLWKNNATCGDTIKVNQRSGESYVIICIKGLVKIK